MGVVSLFYRHDKNCQNNFKKQSRNTSTIGGREKKVASDADKMIGGKKKCGRGQKQNKISFKKYPHPLNRAKIKSHGHSVKNKNK